MLKRTTAILFFATVFAIGGLGIVTNAMATGDSTGDMSEDYSCENFNIQLKNVLRVPGPEDIFRFKYKVTGADLPIYKMALLEFGIEGALVATETDHIKVFPPGEGGFGRDNWLEGIPQLQVLSRRFKKNKEDPFWVVIEIAGTGGNVGTVAAHSKANNNESESGIKSEICFIPGPVPGLPADATVPATKQVVLNGEEGNVEYCIDFDPRTGCPYSDRLPYECDDPEETLKLDSEFVIGSLSENDPDGPVTPTFIGDINSDMRCPVGKAAHNPCQWIILSGRAYGPYCW